jgi:hypothetical protein
MFKSFFSLGTAVLAVTAVCAVVMVTHSGEAGSFQQIQALTMCQAALKKVAPVPEKVSIPSVESKGNAEQFIFTWNSTTKAIEMRTQLDEIEPTTGYCMVDKATKRIIGLTFGLRPII